MYLRVNLLGPVPRLMEKEFTGPSSYGKRIYRAAVLQRLRNTNLQQLYNTCCIVMVWPSPTPYPAEYYAHAIIRYAMPLSSFCVPS